MRTCYKVFHKEGLDFHRYLNVYNTKKILSGNALELQSPTIYLETVKEVEECLSKYPKIKFNKSKDTTRIFPGRSGAVGIWVGTYLAYKAFLSTDADALLMFEDDVVVSKNLFKILGHYASELPEDWDILSLFAPWDTVSKYTSEHDIINKEFLCKIYQDWSTGGYMISRKAAEYAINDIESNGISAPIDFYLYNFRYDGEIPDHIFNSFNIKPSFYFPVQLSIESSYSYIGNTEIFQA
jgi:hypothetical protein